MKDTPAAEMSMTEEQKFLFDLNGWIVLPAVLSAEQIEA
jgi:hypothetical protein